MLSRTPRAPSTLPSSSNGTADRLLRRLDGTIGSARYAHAHDGTASVRHHGAHIGKVHVHMSGRRDHIGDALNGLSQDIVGDLEGLEQRRGFVDDPEQALIRESPRAYRRAV